jgi:hypothetical protein
MLRSSSRRRRQRQRQLHSNSAVDAGDAVWLYGELTVVAARVASSGVFAKRL